MTGTDVGREGCPCTDVGIDTEGDRCPGVTEEDGLTLICAFGPNHEAVPGLTPPDDGKRCMRCPYNDGDYGEGSGCPCGPGDTCQSWSTFNEGPQAPVCTRTEMVCRGAVGDLINGRNDPERRCWDVVHPDAFENDGTCDPQTCDAESLCLYEDCENLDCLDLDGQPGICRAMGMICDPDPYGTGDPYCINIAPGQCDIPDPNNGTGQCTFVNTQGVLNGDQGVDGQQLCPAPYRF